MCILWKKREDRLCTRHGFQVISLYSALILMASTSGSMGDVSNCRRGGYVPYGNVRSYRHASDEDSLRNDVRSATEM